MGQGRLGGGGDSRAAPATVRIDYRNHRGERRWRTITPFAIEFGASPWHPERQWLLRAYDMEKGAVRHFAMRDIAAWVPAGEVAEADGHIDVESNGHAAVAVSSNGHAVHANGDGGPTAAMTAVTPAPAMPAAHQYVIAVSGGDRMYYLDHRCDAQADPALARRFSLPADAEAHLADLKARKPALKMAWVQRVPAAAGVSA